MAGGPRKPDEGVLPWEFVLVLWVGATEEEFSKAKGIFLQQGGTSFLNCYCKQAGYKREEG